MSIELFRSKKKVFALLLLGLLSLLVQGRIEEDAKTDLAMTDRLESELPEMLEEHKAVFAALENLKGERWK